MVTIVKNFVQKSYYLIKMGRETKAQQEKYEKSLGSLTKVSKDLEEKKKEV